MEWLDLQVRSRKVVTKHAPCDIAVFNKLHVAYLDRLGPKVVFNFSDQLDLYDIINALVYELEERNKNADKI